MADSTPHARATATAAAPAAQPQQATAATTPLDQVRQQLAVAGYAKIKAGMMTTPNLSKIETWMHQLNGVVYLCFNELGSWTVLAPIFGRLPSDSGEIVKLLTPAR